MFSKNRFLTIMQIVILASAILFLGYATAADNTLKLPPTTTVVIIEASNGTQSYFDTKLSGVPAGYDVTNGTYLGWCIDVSTEMTRSPATHTVVLYSSLSPPGDLLNENWSKVNYILNHKKGETLDIQEAIWYFINLNSGYLPQRSIALAIVDDANANGTNFVPTANQIVAVIAYPVYITNPYEVQVSIIEVTVPENASEPTPTPTPAPTSSPYAYPTPSPQTTPTPTPTSSPNSSPTPTPSQPNQTSPTPTNGSQGSTGTIGNEVIPIALIAALAAILIILLYWRRRKKRE